MVGVLCLLFVLMKGLYLGGGGVATGLKQEKLCCKQREADKKARQHQEQRCPADLTPQEQLNSYPLTTPPSPPAPFQHITNKGPLGLGLNILS